MVVDDEGRDSRWSRRDTDRQYPANAKHRRVWPYALGLPVALFALWAGVLLYQQVFGTDSRDPLNVNTKSRDIVIVQLQPDGWSRGEVVLVCPGEPDEACVGGGFRKVGAAVTEWTAPAPTRGTSAAEAADDLCRDLARHLAERSTAPALDLETCRTAVAARAARPVLTWTEPRGEWSIATVATPSASATRGERFTVTFRPDVPGD